MKNVLESMEYVEDKFISEAESFSVKRKKLPLIKYVSVAACFILLVSGIAFGGQLFRADNSTVMSLEVQAAEIGKEYIQLGATMPEIINVQDNRVIMYDYIGIWVYDINSKELVGFCDFRPINMTGIQGDPCVCVEATSDGQYVRFYMSDESIKYLYDVKKNSYKQVDEYDSKLSFSSRMSISENKKISNYAETYILEDGTYISYSLDLGDGTDEVRYGDLIIVTEKDGVISQYRPFSNNKADVEFDDNENQPVASDEESCQSEQDTMVSKDVDMEAIELLIKDNYAKTVFKIESMELESQTENSIVYSICASKDGVVQEPNRSIYLELVDGIWQVVDEGY